MGVINEIWQNMTAPLRAEATPENLALWESRAPGWIVTCKKYGLQDPFGRYGIRQKAAGKRWLFGPCRQCGKWSWHPVTRK